MGTDRQLFDELSVSRFEYDDGDARAFINNGVLTIELSAEETH